jgi:predicted RNA-binding Zn-ribbon protein involved in translation (DUF1610 family)
MPAYKLPLRFGANDHPTCPECGNLTRLTRRAPHPADGVEFELQSFECRSCGREIERSAGQLGEVAS